MNNDSRPAIDLSPTRYLDIETMYGFRSVGLRCLGDYRDKCAALDGLCFTCDYYATHGTLQDVVLQSNHSYEAIGELFDMMEDLKRTQAFLESVLTDER
jgi:hypothetical protein